MKNIKLYFKKYQLNNPHIINLEQNKIKYNYLMKNIQIKLKKRNRKILNLTQFLINLLIKLLVFKNHKNIKYREHKLIFMIS